MWECLGRDRCPNSRFPAVVLERHWVQQCEGGLSGRGYCTGAHPGSRGGLTQKAHVVCSGH